MKYFNLTLAADSMHWKSRALRFANRRGDRVNALRRHLAMGLDQVVALSAKALLPAGRQPPFNGDVRFGLITVNFSTTHYLKLMLLTLMEQHSLARLSRIILVDNDSRDDEKGFCRRLASACPKVHLVENRHWTNHARGLRAGIAALERVERNLPADERSNVFLVCDTDIIFRNPDTLRDIAQPFEEDDAAFAGELRHDLYPYPEAQASFFALRRDIYGRREIKPFVHHGAPAYWTQRSLWQAGFSLSDFPSNKGGYILHRGRSAVAATRKYRPRDADASAIDYAPHFMNVVDGAEIWQEAEESFADWLQAKAEDSFIERLSSRMEAQPMVSQYQDCASPAGKAQAENVLDHTRSQAPRMRS